LAALGDLGLLDRVARIGSKTNRVAWHEIGKKTLATLDYSVLDHPHNHLLTVVPSDLELVLRETFSSRGGIIYGSISFRNILPNRSERVLVEAERNGSPVVFSGSIIVGADGEKSKVRQALQVPVRVKEYPGHFLFLLAGPVASLQLEARQYVALGRMAGFFPTRDSTYIFYYLPNRTVAEFKSRGIESFKKQLAEI
jgi:2-polyprenyl-6-methoxyphenol hydroxylase-like FAD-dependent oxidoreductase